MDRDLINRTIDLILNCLEDLLIVLPIYIKSDRIYTLYICQILSSYSMIVFQFYATNGKRFLGVETQKKYLNMIKTIEQQLQIERENDPIINNIESQLFYIKAAFVTAPTYSKEGEAILK